MARKCKCFISKSKLILCEYNAFYFSEIAVIGFTVHEIKQGIVFFGTPGIKFLHYINYPFFFLGELFSGKYIYVIYRIGGPYREIFLEVLKTAEGRGTFLRPREIFLYTDRPYR